MEEYSVYSPFDLQKHKERYHNYLEVIILEDGTVRYAVPSHTTLATALAMEKLGVSEKELSDMCPKHFYGDYLNWLLFISNSVAVWTNGLMSWNVNKAQVSTLRKLKMAGVYRGKVPKIGQTAEGKWASGLEELQSRHPEVKGLVHENSIEDDSILL